MSNELVQMETQVNFKPAELSLTNKDEIIAKAVAIRDKFKKDNLISTPETLAGDKEVLKDLKGKRKELDNARLEVQREYKKPLNAFEADIKEALGIIDEAVLPINKAVKDEEARQKEERHQAILVVATEIFEQYDVSIDELEFNEKWLNKTYQKSKREQEIIEQAMALRAKQDELATNAAAVEKLALGRNLDPEPFIQQLYNNISLASVMENIDEADKKAKARKDRDERLKISREAQEKAQREAKTTTVGDKCIDKETGEVVEEFKTFRFKAKLSVKQAKSLKLFLDEHEIEYEVEGV